MLDVVDDSVVVEVLSKLDRVQDILCVASVRVSCFFDPMVLVRHVVLSRRGASFVSCLTFL